mmetsp:Transcript_32005/g.76458  ORF Transcript_32005/g.76458 Transcript_32005/m.76458 type:complete len:300 (+) Transcript_32005:1081-1980(+)
MTTRSGPWVVRTRCSTRPITERTSRSTRARTTSRGIFTMSSSSQSSEMRAGPWVRVDSCSSTREWLRWFLDFEQTCRVKKPRIAITKADNNHIINNQASLQQPTKYIQKKQASISTRLNISKHRFQHLSTSRFSIPSASMEVNIDQLAINILPNSCLRTGPNSWSVRSLGASLIDPDVAHDRGRALPAAVAAAPSAEPSHVRTRHRHDVAHDAPTLLGHGRVGVQVEEVLMEAQTVDRLILTLRLDGNEVRRHEGPVRLVIAVRDGGEELLICLKDVPVGEARHLSRRNGVVVVRSRQR